ncbi:MAG: hypothetical protein ACI304_02355 [Lepagella sp.]
MKITKFISLLLLAMFLVSCHDDVQPESPYIKTSGWESYVGKHFSCETDQFYWTQHIADDYGYGEDRKIPLDKGQFVEFFDLTDSQISMKYGNEDREYYNLAEATGNAIDKNIACPFPFLGITQTIGLPLIFSSEPTDSYCHFRGEYSDAYGFKYSIQGKIYTLLTISRSRSYESPFPRLRKMICESVESYKIMNLEAPTSDFDKVTLKSKMSPMTIRWNSSAWKGEVASLMQDASDFLQLLLGIHFLHHDDYIKKSKDNIEKISIAELLSSYFPGATQWSVTEYRKDLPTWNFYDTEISLGFKEDVVTISNIADNKMCVMIDPQQFVSNTGYAKGKLFYANILRSLLSEEKCYFEMQYELIDCDFNNQNLEREFHMTLSDPQHSRNIMEYVILPLLIENRQAIKDYIRQDTELSQHADVLCAAVDRLEEIYAGTTDLTLGYRLVENQWHCPDLTR